MDVLSPLVRFAVSCACQPGSIVDQVGYNGTQVGDVGFFHFQKSFVFGQIALAVRGIALGQISCQNAPSLVAREVRVMAI